MTGDQLIGIGCLLAGAWALWALVKGLRDGLLPRERAGFFRREDAPLTFWLSILVYLAGGPFLLFLGVMKFIDPTWVPLPDTD